jgi:MoaA/NifB/PqqE/SkfB family radical SAM enzyme
MLTELSRALNSRPNYMYFMVTSRCNAFCDFCWNWENVADAGKLYRPGKPVKRKELSLDEIAKMTAKLPKMLLVTLLGGEPFLREDFKEIMSLFCRDTEVKYISIPTNGFYTEKILSDLEHALSLHPKTFFRLYISIDGPPLVHDKIRKLKNGYGNAMETARGIAALKKRFANLSLSCNSNYNADTADSMEEHVGTMAKAGIFDAINVNFIRGQPFDPDLKKNITLEGFERIQRLVKQYMGDSDVAFSPLTRAIEAKTAGIISDYHANPKAKRQWKCYSVKKISVVNDQGDVFPCEEMLDTSVGNLRDFGYDLERLFDSPRAREVRASIEAKKCNCAWECGINTSSVFNPLGYPALALAAAKNVVTDRLRPPARPREEP